MKRRTLRNLRMTNRPGHHHHVYVVLLDSAAGKIRSVQAANPRRDPAKPCVYVGLSGLTPEARFANHQQGIKSAWVGKRLRIRLLPEYSELTIPMPCNAV